ncbi:hypothetical protein BC830DRAFT_326337 [Chytriomyces sp. MP71]|nr:hypothetical protein BC830DRAFT_326337 [Chytriomyces sp. MP71]
MEQQATLSPSVPLPGGPNSCKYAGDRPGSAGSDQRSVSGSSAGTGSGIGAWRSRSRSRGREATKAIFSGLATSPATAAPAASYGMRDEESPLSPVALHSPASSLRSPSSPASHKSLSVARSVSSRSLKDKAGGFLSRLFAHKEQRDTPDASNPSSDEISHPLRHRGSGSSTSRDPISAVLAADPLRFKSVKQADSRTSTRKLVPPSNNEFAAMFPTLVRSINDVPDLRDTGFKVFKITVHSFSDTRHINVSESDDGFMIRFEVYKAFEIPHSQWGIGLYSIYNSKNFGAATKDLNDDALYQL